MASELKYREWKSVLCALARALRAVLMRAFVRFCASTCMGDEKKGKQKRDRQRWCRSCACFAVKVSAFHGHRDHARPTQTRATTRPVSSMQILYRTRPKKKLELRLFNYKPVLFHWLYKLIHFSFLNSLHFFSLASSFFFIFIIIEIKFYLFFFSSNFIQKNFDWMILHFKKINEKERIWFFFVFQLGEKMCMILYNI